MAKNNGKIWWLLGILMASISSSSLSAAEPGYIRDVQPLLRKYCGGCHNEADKEGDFSVANFEALSKGTPDGPVLVAGDAKNSRLLKLIHGADEPSMPPDGEARPTEREIAVLTQWIAAGAKNDASTVPLADQLAPPMLTADAKASHYITAMIDVGPQLLALAGPGKCELRDATTQQVVFQIADAPARINQLRLSPDGQFLLVAGGIAGVGGQVIVIDVQKKTVAARIQGHADAIYCAAMSPDSQWLCTGSYDRMAMLWNWREQKVVRKFAGHNGAIYDLDIDSEGKVLATASGDQTVKLWGLKDGTRLDTLGQPEGEMQCVRFTPDGKAVIASGADRQLRLWEIVSKDHPAINPLRLSRFAHEKTITQIYFRGSDQLLSMSEDRSVKLWQLPDLQPLGAIGHCAELPTGLARLDASTAQVLVADYAGLVKALTLPSKEQLAASSAIDSAPRPMRRFQSAAPAPALPAEAVAEREPNNSIADAQAFELPIRLSGSIASESDGAADADLYAFDAKAGQPWIMEIKSDVKQSPLDSLVDVLDSQGQPVLRTRLQAVRASYFTFRGKDSTTIDDYRLHKWQEMELNEFLYAGGEVVKLWLYPRGPDSGFKVYPGYGTRTTFFDTTPTAHPLGETTYIVRELTPGVEPLPNGLPVFPIYFQNDDDAQRRLGKNSRLSFVAPVDGRYLVRVRDARGFGGADFKYELAIRPEAPDFELEFKGQNMTLPPGSGREWQVTAKRLDGLDGPIEIHVENVPDGLKITTPLVIQAGQDIAYGNVYAEPDAKLPEGQDKFTLALRAVSHHPGGEVAHTIDKPLSVALKAAPEVTLKLVDAQDKNRELTELVIHPGETISARVLIDRQEQKGPIALGKEDAGRNLPHGSYVDNIGLNGLLITDENTEREFFITAAKWLEPQEREFHLRSESKNNPTSRSIRLRVLPK